MIFEFFSKLNDSVILRGLPGAGRGRQECSRSLSLPFSHRVVQPHARAAAEALLSAMYFGLAEFSYS